MRKITLLLCILLATSAVTVSAAGGKNRGDRGTGEVHQEQVRNTEKGTPAF